MQNFHCLKIQYLFGPKMQSFRNHSSETYYDVLQVPTDCSNKEIRNAFVQLSKKFHPDVKGIKSDPKQTAQFVRISEAYQILSKQKLRDAYDQDLWAKGIPNVSVNETPNMRTTEIHRPWEVKPNIDANYTGPYYGFTNVKKMSNSKIASALVALGIFGAILGFVSVKHSFTFNQQRLDEKSAQAASHLASVRADAEKFGNDVQLRRVMTRMMQEER